MLRVKLPYLEGWTEARRAHAARYDAAFEGAAGIHPPVALPGNRHVYNQYTIRCDDRDAVKASLDANGIGAGIYYPVPLHLQECFRGLGYGRGDFPVSERACEQVLSLPVYPELTASQQDEVIESVAGA